MNIAFQGSHGIVPGPRAGCIRTSGLTLLEVLVVVGVLVLLAGILLPALAMSKAKAERIKCVNNLKNVGLGFRIFSTDHRGAFPWALSVTNGGTREWVAADGQIWRHWGTLTSDLETPAYLLCPADTERRLRGVGFSAPVPLMWRDVTNTEHVSYFLGLGASEEDPQSILGGDRNVTVDGVAAKSGRLLLGTNSVVGITAEMHDSSGNYLMGDGSVNQAPVSWLGVMVQRALAAPRPSTNVWLVP